MEQYISPEPKESNGKRLRQTDKWKRNMEKMQRYSAKGLPQYPTCKHSIGYQCLLLTMKDIMKFHDAFYSAPVKSKQDAFILKYCRAEAPNPKRKKKDSAKGKSITYYYSIVNEAGKRLKVCRDTFLKVLVPLTKHRIIGVFKKFKKGISHVSVETRGGNRKEARFKPKREEVKSFISSVNASESHYSINKTCRVYLPSDLSVSKLWKIFNADRDEGKKVTQTFFRSVFCTQFNIRFSYPSVDECSKCVELQHRIPLEQNKIEKSGLKRKLQVHKKQAQGFFQRFHSKPPGCLLLSIDCQKYLSLPKITDQSAYFSSQLNCYNVSVVKGLSTDYLNTDNVSVYCWTEDEAKKSSNEIASIIINELKSNDLSNFNSIRLIADGCAGLYKNVSILTMCSKFLASYAPRNIKTIEIVFPIIGHSFVPSDRAFGQIEKVLKRKETVIKKEEYHEVFEKFGRLKLLGRDWLSSSWKEEAKKHVKSVSELHFKLSTCKRIIFRRNETDNVLVRGELAFDEDSGEENSICMVGHRPEDINPPVMSIGVPLKAEKLNDVDKLLTMQFGLNWRDLDSLQWYKKVLDGPTDASDVSDACDCETQEDFGHDVSI